ncbi:hypothetical protein FFI89_023265 [Bradyrhizobium sp. KBS0727]|uniref:hypothetical protein n=1 Tax=unclassified Bradyrhizobium TaxID=2631580 RepID=UPI00110E148E|nr:MULTISPECIES: hypothetical protein [unclassified Bradyrhizobium]QDW39810.1 hypothetical protein FFI71_023270 [Bradyrhizobium sp. KBS0725]QDW46413.1 hypothetical protein FFI89_023265 [Bradyrhizobium sp. KBS0727]
MPASEVDQSTDNAISTPAISLALDHKAGSRYAARPTAKLPPRSNLASPRAMDHQGGADTRQDVDQYDFVAGGFDKNYG